MSVGRRPCRTDDEARSYAADVTEPGAADRILRAFLETFSVLDVLIWSAGANAAIDLPDLTPADWEAQWALNVIAMVSLFSVALPLMTARGKGRVVVVSSTAGRRPSLRNAAYSVTKGAQLHAVKLFADYYAPRGLRINAVAPGPTSTRQWVGPGSISESLAAQRGVSAEAVLEERAASMPTGALATPDEVAAAIVFLCSRWSEPVSGSTWGVDGGTIPFV